MRNLLTAPRNQHRGVRSSAAAYGRIIARPVDIFANACSQLSPSVLPPVMNIRTASQSDLPDIARIQSECYSDHFVESQESFAAKLAANSDFSFIAEQGNAAVGYVFALPWLFGDVPALNGHQYSIPPNADSLYIHDIAVGRSARQGGLAKRLLHAVLDAARSAGFAQVFLVAVQGASSYWQRHGFEAVPIDDHLRRRLAAYGADATYMTRRTVVP